MDQLGVRKHKFKSNPADNDSRNSGLDEEGSWRGFDTEISNLHRQLSRALRNEDRSVMIRICNLIHRAVIKQLREEKRQFMNIARPIMDNLELDTKTVYLKGAHDLWKYNPYVFDRYMVLLCKEHISKKLENIRSCMLSLTKAMEDYF